MVAVYDQLPTFLVLVGLDLLQALHSELTSGRDLRGNLWGAVDPC